VEPGLLDIMLTLICGLVLPLIVGYALQLTAQLPSREDEPPRVVEHSDLAFCASIPEIRHNNIAHRCQKSSVDPCEHGTPTNGKGLGFRVRFLAVEAYKLYAESTFSL